MKELILNDYGMEELNTKEMTEIDGGYLFISVQSIVVFGTGHGHITKNISYITTGSERITCSECLKDRKMFKSIC